MLITDANAIRQILANLRLENMRVSDTVNEMINRALNGEAITTTDIIDYIKRTC